MSYKPYCPKGTQRCSVSKKCITKNGSRSTRCPKGTRKCADAKCYKKTKSTKTRTRFIRRHGA